MKNISTKNFWMCIIAGFVIRILLMLFREEHFDFINFYNSAKLVFQGENIYASTKFYNYGPVFSLLLGMIYRISIFFTNNRAVFKLLFVCVTSFADIMTSLLIVKKKNNCLGALFFLNPLSISISRYQFDSLAFMMAAYGANFMAESYQENKIKINDLLGIILLSLSFMTKHFMAFFPIWILLNTKTNSRKKYLYVFIPPILFLLSFVPYLPEGLSGIIDNVFMYRSAKNFPLIALTMMKHLNFNVDFIERLSFPIFIMLMIIFGYLFRHKNIFNSFLMYCVSLVCFSSGLFVQYFTLPIMTLLIYHSKITLPYFIIFVVCRPNLISKMTGLSYRDSRSVVWPFMVWLMLYFLIDYYRKNKIQEEI